MIEQNKALEVARAAGLDLQRKGSRWWTCCPLHGERTASLCFFADGKWHCFGCSAHGDAADLYAALHGVSLGEALRTVNGGEWCANPHKPTAHDLRRAVERWKGDQWREACDRKHKARAIVKAMENTAPDSEQFWQAVAEEAAANDILNLLEQATPRQIIRYMEGMTHEPIRT